MSKMTQEQLREVIKGVIADMQNGSDKGKQTPPTSQPQQIAEAAAQVGPSWSPSDAMKQHLENWMKLNFSPVLPSADDQRGLKFAQTVRAIAGAKFAQNSGNAISPAQWAKDMYGENHPVTKALAATTFSGGGAVIAEQLSADIIEFLRAASVVRAMNPNFADISTGNLTIPKMTVGSNFSWIGENQNLTTTQPQFGQVKLSAKKGGAVVPISNDFLRRANPRADQMIRDDVIASLAVGTDLAYIRGDGLADNPKGLRHLAPAANILTVTGGGDTLANMTADLGRLILQLLNNNIRMLRPGWLMAPRSMVRLMTVQDGNGNYVFRQEMLGGRLWNWPFAVTTNIPINLAVTATDESEVYLVDFADVVIGDALNIQVDISMDAAYFDGAQVQAAFSLDQTVIRAIMETDIQARHAEAIAVLSDVNWVP